MKRTKNLTGAPGKTGPTGALGPLSREHLAQYRDQLIFEIGRSRPEDQTLERALNLLSLLAEHGRKHPPVDSRESEIKSKLKALFSDECRDRPNMTTKMRNQLVLDVNDLHDVVEEFLNPADE
jgi:hypothetical protein